MTIMVIKVRLQKNFTNVLQNNFSLSFENVEGRSEEEKIMIKNITEIAEHNLEEEVNGFKKVDRLDNEKKCYSERN